MECAEVRWPLMPHHHRAGGSLGIPSRAHHLMLTQFLVHADNLHLLLAIALLKPPLQSRVVMIFDMIICSSG